MNGQQKRVTLAEQGFAEKTIVRRCTRMGIKYLTLSRLQPLILAVVLSGCAVGPDFMRPKLLDVESYTAEPIPNKTAESDGVAGAAQRFIEGKDIPVQWWTVFHSPLLNGLINDALAANSNILSAEAALRVAQENVYAQRGAYFPSVSANFSPSRQKTAPVLSSPLSSGDSVYSLHTAQLNVSYAVDVFGGNRRLVESLQAQADSQKYQLVAAQLSVTSNLVAAVVQLASLRDQISATDATIELLREQLRILRKQLELGAIAESNVIAQEGALAQTEATLPALNKQLAQQRDLIAALTGRYPSQVGSLDLSLSDLVLPTELPLTLPSTLVQKRPDIRSAEEQLHAASAQIGVAVANMFPQISITAGQGSTATAIADLFTSGTGFWSIAGSLTQPLFQGGTLLHRKRSAQAAFDQAAAQYQGTVIAALQSVADALHAIRFDAEAVRAATAAETSTRSTLDIVRRQLELGDVSYLALLQADQAYQQSRIAAIQARAGRLADSAALFQALCGGWSDSGEPVARAVP